MRIPRGDKPDHGLAPVAALLVSAAFQHAALRPEEPPSSPTWHGSNGPGPGRIRAVPVDAFTLFSKFRLMRMKSSHRILLADDNAGILFSRGPSLSRFDEIQQAQPTFHLKPVHTLLEPLITIRQTRSPSSIEFDPATRNRRSGPPFVIFRSASWMSRDKGKFIAFASANAESTLGVLSPRSIKPTAV